jgi:hypothetical protein
MRRRIARRRDWKLNIAVYVERYSYYLGEWRKRGGIGRGSYHCGGLIRLARSV